MLCAIVAATFALTGTAFAATVHGADFSGDGSEIEKGNIDVLNVDGSAGETIFLAVNQGKTVIAKNLPYTIGASASAGDEFTWTGTATLDITGFDLKNLNGNYTIQAFSDRAGKSELYSGKLYGVYADLPDNTSILIGTRTVNDAEAAGRAFNAPTNIYSNGKTYLLEGEGANQGGALHFKYKEYDASRTATAVVNYVDGNGNVVARSEIPGIEKGKQKTMDVPSVVVADNGDVYRTVYFLDAPITARNPEALSFNLYCTKMSDRDKALAGYFVATIKMVDEAGATIASDTVNVTGSFVYTAPATIYKKTTTSAGDPAVITYDIKGSPTIHLSAQDNDTMERARTITVEYETTEPTADTEVTFNLIDGSKRILDRKGGSLGTKKVTATPDSPTVVPDATVTVDGKAYNIVGSPDDYAFTLRQGQIPRIDVYYTPEGYTADQPYDFTVNYVNFLTNEVIQSQTYTSMPNEMTTIPTDASFANGGVEYVRLDGQEEDIQHSYYSGIGTYVVYYRDVNDTLTSGTVINRIRVQYRDGGDTGTTVTNGGTTTTTTGTVGADGTAADGTAADGTVTDGAPASLNLNPDTTYNVANGNGANGTLTNESGIDSNTERIEDSETPLASGFDKGGASTAASSLTAAMVPIGIAIVVAIVIAALFMIIRRRKNDEANEA